MGTELQATRSKITQMDALKTELREAKDTIAELEANVDDIQASGIGGVDDRLSQIRQEMKDKATSKDKEIAMAKKRYDAKLAEVKSDSGASSNATMEATQENIRL